MVYCTLARENPEKTTGAPKGKNALISTGTTLRLRGDEKKFQPSAPKPEGDPAASDDRGTGPVIRCRNCRHRITTADHRKIMNGSHRHIFNNPAGIIFEIGLFDVAEGCAALGRPSMEFTWFSGYAWRFALCGNCGIHLGWLYTGAEGGFFGLILEMIVEDSGGKSNG